MQYFHDYYKKNMLQKENHILANCVESLARRFKKTTEQEPGCLAYEVVM